MNRLAPALFASFSLALLGASAPAGAQSAAPACQGPAYLSAATMAGSFTALAKVCDQMPDDQVAAKREHTVRSAPASCAAGKELGVAFDTAYRDALAKANAAPAAQMQRTCQQLRDLPKLPGATAPRR